MYEIFKNELINNTKNCRILVKITNKKNKKIVHSEV